MRAIANSDKRAPRINKTRTVVNMNILRELYFMEGGVREVPREVLRVVGGRRCEARDRRWKANRYIYQE